LHRGAPARLTLNRLQELQSGVGEHQRKTGHKAEVNIDPHQHQ
jgi:hypothetical protein